jgi:hypothetical protein
MYVVWLETKIIGPLGYSPELGVSADLFCCAYSHYFCTYLGSIDNRIASIKGTNTYTFSAEPVKKANNARAIRYYIITFSGRNIS